MQGHFDHEIYDFSWSHVLSVLDIPSEIVAHEVAKRLIQHIEWLFATSIFKRGIYTMSCDSNQLLRQDAIRLL
ncbi:hypothetical protein A7X83_13990 [Stenotrophomonas maltophilia]|uniref:Uncharacterized protein n=1 Tax=Stenotrophomonas maltophilia TaxID=40324 RepID=A0A2W6IQE8_STEMA|nr:hypothetical protein A7X83_13990 [Stenotrophomonas maltophilia]